MVTGTLRFRLLRGRPSHEKLYLLSGPVGHRVLTGSANLSLAAFEGRQHEVNVAFDGEHAWRLFDGYYQRDWKDSVPIEPDALIASRANSIAPSSVECETFTSSGRRLRLAAKFTMWRRSSSAK